MDSGIAVDDLSGLPFRVDLPAPCRRDVTHRRECASMCEHPKICKGIGDCASHHHSGEAHASTIWWGSFAPQGPRPSYNFRCPVAMFRRMLHKGTRRRAWSPLLGIATASPAWWRARALMFGWISGDPGIQMEIQMDIPKTLRFYSFIPIMCSESFRSLDLPTA